MRGSDTQGLYGGGPDREPRAAVYFAAAQLPQRTMTLVVRTAADDGRAMAVMPSAVREADPAVPLRQARPMRDWIAESVAAGRLTTTMAAAFAGCALLLAAVGIYGVLAYSVASRAREIGVRMAIGAAPGDVIGMVLRDGMTWAAGGIAAGLAGASLAASFIATLLFEVPSRDPLTFAAVAGAVALVAVIACSIPAARAAAVDPTIAMRSE